jgi:HlyD family secretion protein
MKRTLIGMTVVAAAIAAVDYGLISASIISARPRTTPAHATSTHDVDRDIAAAGPGRVEPASEEIRVAAEISGRLERVLVEEGRLVQAGDPIAILEHRDYAARVRAAEADLRLREAEARRVGNGAREQERRDAAAAVREAAAVLDHAAADLERHRELFREAVISRDEMDRAERQSKVAQARLDSLRERQSLADADAREEDQARADANVELARARLAEARAIFDKTTIRAPIGGVILRKHRKDGESVSTQFDSPVVTMADRSTLRVRVDIDEADVARVHVGQPAYVTTEAFGDRRFTGTVVRVGQILGRKNVRTDEPTERVDTKILETLIRLDDGRELPLGLRVQAFLLTR